MSSSLVLGKCMISCSHPLSPIGGWFLLQAGQVPDHVVLVAPLESLHPSDPCRNKAGHCTSLPTGASETKGQITGDGVAGTACVFHAVAELCQQPSVEPWSVLEQEASHARVCLLPQTMRMRRSPSSGP